jgi:hypothetical protein
MKGAWGEGERRFMDDLRSGAVANADVLEQNQLPDIPAES